MTAPFTDKQGQYLAFIYNYIVMFGTSPAEAELERFFQTSFPTIHQMVVRLEEKGLISRVPGQARSIKVLVDPDDIPRLRNPRAMTEKSNK
ncbi:MAG TPA: helix-turn-helix domain-containing protein [Syntrophales bacterium]|nr:helix-turn-helix domain-containing protein [Syntrophales bacterium]